MSSVSSDHDGAPPPPPTNPPGGGYSFGGVGRFIGSLRDWVSPASQPTEPDLAFLNTRKVVGTGRFIILVFFLGFMGWAAVVPLASAIQSPGVIVVESHRKTIQHLEGGIVDTVNVKEGDAVHAGELMVQLDDTQARSSLQLLKGEGDAMMAQEARLTAERDGDDHVTFPADLLARQNDPKVAEAIKGETNTFKTRRETLLKQVDILNQRNSENNSMIAGLKKEQESIDLQMMLVQKETTSVETLYARGLSTLPRFLALQRQSADLTGQRGQLVEKIAQVQLSSGENELQAMNVKNQYMSDVVKDLRDVQTKRFDLLDRIHAAQDVLNRLTIRAPVTGKVVGLAVHAKGAVVRPGDTIMEIVPLKDELEVEARVRPEDADSIHIGMDAHVSMSAYQRRRLPTLNGVVRTISADRLTDQRTGQPYFSVLITVDKGPLRGFSDAKLLPGLPVEVALETGDRTAMSYFTEPITDVFRKGMREK
jgi:HlyD family type I secretion membrane fusion protein